MTLDNKTLLFIGDSITDMARGRNLADLNHIYGHSYVFLIASLLGCEYPEKRVTIHNRGISGNKTTDIAARWEEDALALKPDVISLLAGINDILFDVIDCTGVTADEYYSTFTRLIAESRERLPGVEFVICEPFGSAKAASERYSNAIASRIDRNREMSRSLAEDNSCIFVPLQEEFDALFEKYPELGEKYWLWDGIHPTAQGQRVVAKKWLNVVADGITL